MVRNPETCDGGDGFCPCNDKPESITLLNPPLPPLPSSLRGRSIREAYLQRCDRTDVAGTMDRLLDESKHRLDRCIGEAEAIDARRVEAEKQLDTATTLLNDQIELHARYVAAVRAERATVRAEHDKLSTGFNTEVLRCNRLCEIAREKEANTIPPVIVFFGGTFIGSLVAVLVRFAAGF